MHTITSLQADKAFDVEISGNEHADTAILFVHGFGVKRDSRGLFTEIEKLFINKAISIRGDFIDTEKSVTRALPISTQANRLTTIMQYTNQKFHPKRIVYIGHSQGALVIAKAFPTNSTVYLLAPPLMDAPSEHFALTEGWKRPGSHLDISNESRLMRSDKSITLVGADFWSDFETYHPGELYSRLNKQNTLHILFAEHDQVLGVQNAPASIDTRTIPDTNHDFKGVGRPILMDTLFESISKKI